MSPHFRFALVTVFAAVAMGCGRDNGVQPAESGDPMASRLSSIEIVPATVALEVGDTLRVSVEARDQFGRDMSYSGGVEYSIGSDVSGTAGIVTVSSTGLVTAVTPGTATISVRLTIDGVTKSGSVKANVVTQATEQAVAVTFRNEAWDPSLVHLSARGTVTWQVDSVSQALDLPRQMWVIYPDDVRQVLDLSGGPASVRFTRPGLYYYCTGACRGGSDTGIVNVQ